MDSNHRSRKTADLQSAPFGHSGICPDTFRLICDAKVVLFFELPSGFYQILPITALEFEEICQINHFDGRDGTLIALISVDSTGTVLGLLHSVGSDESEDDGDVSLGIE